MTLVSKMLAHTKPVNEYFNVSDNYDFYRLKLFVKYYENACLCIKLLQFTAISIRHT